MAVKLTTQRFFRNSWIKRFGCRATPSFGLPFPLNCLWFYRTQYIHIFSFTFRDLTVSIFFTLRYFTSLRAISLQLRFEHFSIFLSLLTFFKLSHFCFDVFAFLFSSSVQSHFSIFFLVLHFSIFKIFSFQNFEFSKFLLFKIFTKMIFLNYY